MKKLQFAEQGFTALSLLLFSGGPIGVILSGGVSPGDGRTAPSNQPLIQLVFLIIYVFTFFLLIKHWKQVLTLCIKEKFIWLLVGIAIVSAFWSLAPALTIRRSIALVGTTLFGIYFATRYSLKQQLKLLGWTFSIAILLSFLFALTLPEYGIMSGAFHSGTWRGIYSHKNILGRVMTLSVIVFLLLAVDTRKNRFLFWCGFSLSLVLLILSTSKTALVSSIVILAGLFLYWALQRRYSIAISCIIAVAMLSGSLLLQVKANIYAPIVLQNVIPVSPDTSLMEPQKSPSVSTEELRTLKDEDLLTLTGRTKLWFLVIKIIKQRPLLGYGYSGFWGVTEESAALPEIAGEFAQYHSHNGFLEISLQLGLVGLSIFLIGFLFNLFRVISWLRMSRATEGLWTLLYIVFLVLANLTSSTLLQQNSIFWVLYVSVVFSMLTPINRLKEKTEEMQLSESPLR